MEKTAKLIQKIETEKRTTVLYKLSHPYFDNDYILISAVNIDLDDPFIKLIDNLNGNITLPCETFIFCSDKNGNVENFKELEGSQRGIFDIKKVLNNIGYKEI